MVYNQFYFEDKTEYANEKLYKIDENLTLEEIYNSQLIENMRSKFKTSKYVNNYVYHNDKLIKTDSILRNEYKLIRTYKNENTIVCKTSDTIPSIAGVSTFDIMPEQKIKGKYNKIKIKLMTDIIINDYVFQDKQMMLNIICSEKKYKYVFRDHITKYLTDDNIICGEKYNLLVEKEIKVNDLDKFSVHIFIRSNTSDYKWEPNKKITLSNIRVLIYGK
jgi:hypothetical protein